MNDTTSSPSPTSEGLKFVDNLYFLLEDCRSGDPSRALLCRVNTALGVLSSLVLPVFMLAGFFGNSITVYIYMWKLRPRTRQAVYFSAIAVSDNCNLFMFGLMWMFLAKGLPWISNGTVGYFHLNSSPAACTVVRYLEQCFYLTSSTLFLAMVIDRVLSVYFPFKFQLTSPKTATKVCLLVVLIDMLITIPMGVIFTWIQYDNNIICFYNVQSIEETNALIGIVSLLLYYPPLLPIGLIFLTNLLLIWKMRSIVLEQRQLREGDASRENILDKLSNTLICVILSVILLVSSAPMVFASLLQTGGQSDVNYIKFLWSFNDISQILVLFNESINWIILLWKSPQFRKAFVAIFK